MSVYRTARSPYWHFDFQWRGHRFHGSTKRTTRREAEKVEAAEREKAKAHVAQLQAARTSLRLDDVAGRYWSEVGQHHAAPGHTERYLSLLIEYFDKNKLVTDITDDDVTKLVAWYRGRPRKGGGLRSPFTINHLTGTLRKLFTRAKLWGVRFQHEPMWRRHWLAVPAERVRELSDDEAERLEAVTRDDYAPFFAFARASGLRLAECLLRWPEVDWGARQIRKTGKGGRLVTVPITPMIREILWPLRAHHPEFVFTYVCQRGRRGRARGERQPLTYGGVHTVWQRLRKRAGVAGFRFHDFRHDFATKLLRECRNPKVVQRGRSITPTLRPRCVTRMC